MGQALLEAQKAYEADEVPVGAVVVYDNRILARAHNRVQHSQDATAHAELLALQMACKKLQAKYLPECTLYITLEPCAMCASATYWLQLGHLVFATQDLKKGYSLWSQSLLHPKTKLTHGPLATASKVLLQSFFKALRQKSTL